MAKYKVTAVEQHSGNLIAEVINSEFIPQIQTPVHYFSDGRMSLFVKLELVIEADAINTYDNTENT